MIRELLTKKHGLPNVAFAAQVLQSRLRVNCVMQQEGEMCNVHKVHAAISFSLIRS